MCVFVQVFANHIVAVFVSVLFSIPYAGSTMNHNFMFIFLIELFAFADVCITGTTPLLRSLCDLC